jgi:hypothetical protein
MDIQEFMTACESEGPKENIIEGLKRCIYLFTIFEEGDLSSIASPSLLVFRNVVYEVAFGFRIIDSNLMDKFMLNSESFASSFIELMFQEIEQLSIQAWVDYLFDSYGEEFITIECGPYFQVTYE